MSMELMPAQGVKLLDWQPYGYHGQYLKAAAFGVDAFYRIDGSPEDWMLHLPRERSYIEMPGYVTRADAQAAAWADYIARVRAAQDEAEFAPVAFTSLAAIKAVAEGRTAWMFPLREGDDPSMAISLYAVPAAQDALKAEVERLREISDELAMAVLRFGRKARALGKYEQSLNAALSKHSALRAEQKGNA